MVNDLHVSAHQDVIAYPYKVFGSDHAMTANDRVITDVDLWIRFCQLEECVILDGAAIAHFQHSIVRQPELRIVFYDNLIPGPCQVFF